MNDTFTQRVRSAAVAGWWTVLIGAGWLTVVWLIWLALLAAQPGWLITLWGGGELTWDKVQTIMINFMAVFKVILWICVLATIWATMWAVRLKRTGGQ